jgi:hypothetical protein
MKVTRLLSSCLIGTGDVTVTSDLVRKLLVGDRDYLMLQLRRLTLGDNFQAVLACQACGAKIDVNFGANEVPVERRPQTAPWYVLTLRDPQPAGRTVRFRLPTGADQEAVLEANCQDPSSSLLDRCLLDDGGLPLGSEEREVVIEAIERMSPKVELELDLTCPECGEAFAVPFDTTAFFLEEMRINGGLFLREVHALACCYHWSEADILGLKRNRRRAYLALLSDAVQE